MFCVYFGEILNLKYFNPFSLFFFLVSTANVKGLVTKGKLTQDKAQQALSLLKGSLDYSDFKDVDMVIEVRILKF